MKCVTLLIGLLVLASGLPTQRRKRQWESSEEEESEKASHASESEETTEQIQIDARVGISIPGTTEATKPKVSHFTAPGENHHSRTAGGLTGEAYADGGDIRPGPINDSLGILPHDTKINVVSNKNDEISGAGATYNRDRNQYDIEGNFYQGESYVFNDEGVQRDEAVSVHTSMDGNLQSSLANTPIKSSESDSSSSSEEDDSSDSSSSSKSEESTSTSIETAFQSPNASDSNAIEGNSIEFLSPSSRTFDSNRLFRESQYTASTSVLSHVLSSGSARATDSMGKNESSSSLSQDDKSSEESNSQHGVSESSEEGGVSESISSSSSEEDMSSEERSKDSRSSKENNINADFNFVGGINLNIVPSLRSGSETTETTSNSIGLTYPMTPLGSNSVITVSTSSGSNPNSSTEVSSESESTPATASTSVDPKLMSTSEESEINKSSLIVTGTHKSSHSTVLSLSSRSEASQSQESLSKEIKGRDLSLGLANRDPNQRRNKTSTPGSISEDIRSSTSSSSSSSEEDTSTVSGKDDDHGRSSEENGKGNNERAVPSTFRYTPKVTTFGHPAAYILKPVTVVTHRRHVTRYKPVTRDSSSESDSSNESSDSSEESNRKK